MDLGDKLLLASVEGDLDTVKKLIFQGVDIETQSSGYTTALSNACEIVKFLISSGANIEAKNNLGNSCLDYIEDEKVKEELKELSYFNPFKPAKH